jgi:hypothetical protein
VIADQGAEQEPRQPSAESLLEARVRVRTSLCSVVERGAVLEEEHRPTPASKPVGRGCGHAFLLSTGRGAPLHP